MAKVAFIGLGVMGFPMAGHLATKGGHEVTVYNRNAAKADKWVAQYGGKKAATPKEATAGQDFVMMCVGNDNDVREVALGGSGAFDGVKKGAVFVDHTTASAEVARQLHAEAKKRGFDFVDAPVSGGQAGAENGKLAIMCGGSEAAMAAAQPIIEAYAARIVHVGGPGAGQATKAVNQVCIAGVLAGLSEAVRLAQAEKLDLPKVLEAISGGAAMSWQMVNRWDTMAKDEFDFGFAIDWMRKDLAIALAEGQALGLELPVTKLVDGYYGEVQALGGNRQDTSALIRRLPKGTA